MYLKHFKNWRIMGANLTYIIYSSLGAMYLYMMVCEKNILSLEFFAGCFFLLEFRKFVDRIAKNNTCAIF